MTEPEMKVEPIDRAILDALVGRTITGVELHPSGSAGFMDDGEWLGGVTIRLDDGSFVTLTGWGHDWWGLNVGGTMPRTILPSYPPDVL